MVEADLQALVWEMPSFYMAVLYILHMNFAITCDDCIINIAIYLLTIIITEFFTIEYGIIICF